MSQPSNEPRSIRIHSGSLVVDIAEPGAVYRRSRFDWSGFITQVTLNGAHTFCVPEDYDPRSGSGGVGLCGEFGNQKIFGYADAHPGDAFPKPGIGLLVRPKEPGYSFFKDYEVAAPFPVSVDCAEDSARFTVEPIECRGYAFREVKTIRLEDDCLEVTVQFENVGSKAIHTHEYYHNFMGINQQLVGPDYSLRFAAPVAFKSLLPVFRKMLPGLLGKITPNFILAILVNRMMKQDVLVVNGHEITWNTTPERPFFSHLTAFAPTSQPQWVLTHTPSGLSISETDNFAPAQVVLWGTRHVVSAEVYVDIDLEPGQMQTWTRRYQFRKPS